MSGVVKAKKSYGLTQYITRLNRWDEFILVVLINSYIKSLNLLYTIHYGKICM